MRGRALPGIAAGLVCGLLIALFARSAVATREAHSGEVAALLQAQTGLVARQQALLAQRDELEGALGALIEAAGEDHAPLRQQLLAAQALAGLADMGGPGVEVILDDAPKEAIRPQDDINYYIVHDVDVLRVINSLKAAGAECIAINGERLLSHSRIRCGGPTIRIKDSSFAPPFVIRAIGDPQALADALAAREPEGGMSELEVLRFFGVRAEVRQLDWVQVPRYVGELRYRYAEVR